MNIKTNLLGEPLSIEIDQSHYLRRLGFPKDYEAPEHVQESMDWASRWYRENGNPWLEIFELDVALNEENIFLNNILIKAPKVYKRFKKYDVKKAMLIAATAGEKADQEISNLWSSDHPDRSFFLETYASSVTESLVEFAVDQIKNWTGHKNQSTLSRYSPGYPGWELKEQITLMEIIRNLTDVIPVSVSDTSLLLPLKSQLSLVGIYQGEQKEKDIKIECMQCNFNDCSCRKKDIYIKV